MTAAPCPHHELNDRLQCLRRICSQPSRRDLNRKEFRMERPDRPPIDHAALRALAEAEDLMPAPWTARMGEYCYVTAQNGQVMVAQVPSWAHDTARYIAAVPPSTTLALLNEIDRLRHALETALQGTLTTLADDLRLRDAERIVRQHNTASGAPRGTAA